MDQDKVEVTIGLADDGFYYIRCDGKKFKITESCREYDPKLFNFARKQLLKIGVNLTDQLNKTKKIHEKLSSVSA